MPVTYHTSASGVRYPVYSGSAVLGEIHKFYMTHAATYGYSPRQMALVLAGHPQPVSAALRARLKRSQETHCCSFDPRTVKVGQTIPSMAGHPFRVPGTPVWHGKAPDDAVVGTLPATPAAGSGTILSSGAVVHPAPKPASLLLPVLICAFALVAALLVAFLVRHYLGGEEKSPVHVAPVPVSK